jgi:glyoxylase-like metal-dependent hydrolase (beta-lactamase superfamily II)
MRRLLITLAIAGCTPGPRITIPAERGAKIGTITLGWSQVHVVFGGRYPLIVDSGSSGEFGQILGGLKELGVSLADVKCAVITHGHADHAGTAAAMQVKGVKIIAGAADRERFQHGEHGPHHPTGVLARILEWFIPDHYKPFTPDVQVTDRYDLAPECGVDGEAIVVGGHTAGALVVIVGGGKIALVGDLFRGGLAHKHEPTVHFFQDDLELAHRRIRELVARGVEWFVLGHDGPATRADVERVFGHT